MSVDVAFWRNLADRFRSLPDTPDPQPSPAAAVMGTGPQALWAEYDEDGWRLRSGTPIVSEMFTVLASVGAGKLAAARRDWPAWLDELRDRSGHCQRRELSVAANRADDQSNRTVVVGAIYGVARVSAEYCERLADQAMLSPNPPPTVLVSPRRTESAQQRAERRMGIVDPLLKDRGFTKSKWAAVTGVDPGVVYDYCRGVSSPRPETRNSLAQALGVDEGDLPE